MVGAGKQQKHRLAQYLPPVDLADLRAAAVQRHRSVVPQHKNAALRHRQRKHRSLVIGGQLLEIGLFQGFPIHIDQPLVKVNIHLLAFRGDDPLDNGLSVFKALLADDHDVPRLRFPAEGLADQQQIISVPERIVHGILGHHNHPEKDKKHQHNCREHIHKIMDIQHQGLGSSALLGFLLG